MKMNRFNSGGFTLLEMMIVVAIIGVLAGIAYPNYIGHVQKTKRSDAKTALLALQQLQEKLRSNCNVYARNLDTTITNDDGDSIPFECAPGDPANTSINLSANSEEGWYTLSITSADANGIGYVAMAGADTGDDQAGDSNCQALILTVNADNPNGLRTSNDKRDATGAPTTGCW